MENINNLNYEDCNILVYAKRKHDKKFRPIASLQKMTFAPDGNLMYAALFPYSKLETLKEYLEGYRALSEKHGGKIQIRSSKNRKKVLHEI